MRKTRTNTLCSRKLRRLLAVGATVAALAPAMAGADAPGPGSGNPQGFTADPATVIAQEFARFDVDKDGAIALAEFERHGGKPEAFKRADADRDGRLAPEEYAKARARSDWIELGEFFDDAWITTRIKAMLLKDAAVDGLDVRVRTEDGVVQLSGFVDSGQQASRAVAIASSVSGVKQVINDLVTRKS